MLEAALISTCIAAMSALGIKVRLLKREADDYIDEWNQQAPIVARTFRAQVEIDCIHLHASERIRQAELEARQ